MKYLQPGQNPRDHLSKHCERSFKQFTYTYEDIAAACEMTVESVRNAVAKKRFYPGTLESVIDFILVQRQRSKTKGSRQG